MPFSPARVLRFGTFEVDVEARELRKSGLEVKLQEQPRQVLLALLERPGQIVTREELRQRLWPDGTYVDFEHGLNTAVKKLRDALGDAAENPRFIETVPLRGYRFTGPVDRLGRDGSEETSPAAPRRRIRAGLVGGSAALVIGVAAAFWWVTRPAAVPKLLGSTQLTYTGRVLAPDLTREAFHPLVTDGTRIYFGEAVPGSPAVIAQVSAAGGEVVSVSDGHILDLSADGSKLLVRRRQDLGSEAPLWVVPALGGAPRRLGALMAHAGAWSPDGYRIAYSQGEDLYVANADGTEPRRVASAPGRAVWLRWSPDGSRLRFTLIKAQTHGRSLWEVSAVGTNLRPLLPAGDERGDECCGEWTRDGRRFVFRAHRDGTTDIWVLQEGAGPFQGRRAEAVRLTTGPLDFSSAVPSRDGRRLFVVGTQPRGEILKYDLGARAFTIFQPGLAGGFFTYSRDAAWVAWVEFRGREANLWRSRVDGSERVQLTSPPLRVYNLYWSPDATRIAFMGRRAGEPWKMYLINADGGTPDPVLDWDRSEADPNFSVDGHSLMFGHPPDYMAEPNFPKAIRLVDLRTRQVSTLPGSEGLFSPRWSPDGRYVAAMPLDQTKIMLFDHETGKWSELVPGREGGRQRSGRWHANYPFWSRDSKLLYFQNFAEERGTLYRIHMSDRSLERVVDFADIKRPVLICHYRSLALDGSPLATCNVSTSDIYALEWDAR